MTTANLDTAPKQPAEPTMFDAERLKIVEQRLTALLAIAHELPAVVLDAHGLLREVQAANARVDAHKAEAYRQFAQAKAMHEESQKFIAQRDTAQNTANEQYAELQTVRAERDKLAAELQQAREELKTLREAKKKEEDKDANEREGE